MKRFISVFVVFSLILFLLSSCSLVTIQSVDELVRPPENTSDNEALLKTFYSSLGGDQNTASVVLKPPVSGSYTSAIVSEDIDGDKVDEALIFYSFKGMSESPHVGFFKKAGTAWKRIADFSGYGNEVGELRLSDLNNDGIKEILISWQDVKAAEHKIAVYAFRDTDNKYCELFNAPYEFNKCFDFDSDGKDELVVISRLTDDSGTSNIAGIYKFNGEKLLLISDVKLDPSVVQYSAHSYSAFYGKLPCILIDGYLQNGSMITEMVLYEPVSGTASDPFVNNIEGVNTATLRYSKLVMRDIDMDGLPEVPTQIEYADGSNEFLTVWSGLEDSKLVPRKYCYINLAGSWLYTFDENEAVNYSVSVKEDGTAEFSRYTDDYDRYVVLFSVSGSDKYVENSVRVGESFVNVEISSVGEKLGLTVKSIGEKINSFDFER